MRNLGLFSIITAAGLALAGAAGAQQPAAAPAGTTNTAPTTVAATAPAAPTSPLLAQDGAPAIDQDAAIGRPIDKAMGIQPQVTRNGEFARWFHDSILFPVITLISLFVLALLIYAVIRFRKAANPIPSKTSHHTWLEVAWTLIPVVMLVADRGAVDRAAAGAVQAGPGGRDHAQGDRATNGIGPITIPISAISRSRPTC